MILSRDEAETQAEELLDVRKCQIGASDKEGLEEHALLEIGAAMLFGLWLELERIADACEEAS